MTVTVMMAPIVNPEHPLASLGVAVFVVGVAVGDAVLGLVGGRLVTGGGAAVPVPSSKTSNLVANWLCRALWSRGMESLTIIPEEGVPPCEMSTSAHVVYASKEVLSMFGQRLQSQTQYSARTSDVISSGS